LTAKHVNWDVAMVAADDVNQCEKGISLLTIDKTELEMLKGIFREIYYFRKNEDDLSRRRLNVFIVTEKDEENNALTLCN
jgi:hypothetical protein